MIAKDYGGRLLVQKRDLFDGAARFENICASTPGRFRLVRAPIFVNANTAITFLSTSKQLRIATIQEFKSTPSNCSTYIDFDVVWRVSEVLNRSCTTGIRIPLNSCVRLCMRASRMTAAVVMSRTASSGWRTGALWPDCHRNNIGVYAPP